MEAAETFFGHRLKDVTLDPLDSGALDANFGHEVLF